MTEKSWKVKKSKIHGAGIFATKKINKGEKKNQTHLKMVIVKTKEKKMKT